MDNETSQVDQTTDATREAEAAPDGRKISPMWFVLFSFPGACLLLFWTFRALVSAKFDGGPEALFAVALAVPAIGLIRVPTLVERPPRRFPTVDDALATWGLALNAWLQFVFPYGLSAITLFAGAHCAGRRAKIRRLTAGSAFVARSRSSTATSLPSPRPGDSLW